VGPDLAPDRRRRQPDQGRCHPQDPRGQTTSDGAIVFRVTDASRIIMTNLASQVQVTYKGVDPGTGVIATGNGKVAKI